jgi:hypothetical protein
MPDWFGKGCEKCRAGVLSASWPPPSRIACSVDLHAYLHRCDFCGAYWQFNEREAHVIEEAEAITEFPDAVLHD